MDDRELAQAAAFIELITEHQEQLLTLRGWVRQVDGTYRDGSGDGAPYTRDRALRIVAAEVHAARKARVDAMRAA